MKAAEVGIVQDKLSELYRIRKCITRVGTLKIHGVLFMDRQRTQAWTDSICGVPSSTEWAFEKFPDYLINDLTETLLKSLRRRETAITETIKSYGITDV